MASTTHALSVIVCKLTGVAEEVAGFIAKNVLASGACCATPLKAIAPTEVSVLVSVLAKVAWTVYVPVPGNWADSI